MGLNLSLSLTGSQAVGEASPITATAPFGALTRQGQGGFPVTGSSISSGDPSGHWQVSGGNLSPSATGEDTISGSYSLVLNDGQEVDVTVSAGVRTVNGTSELTTALQAGAAVNNAAIEYRRSGTYGEINLNNHPLVSAIPDGVTVRPCTESGTIPAWDWLSIQSGGAEVGNVTFTGGVVFGNVSSNDTHNFLQPQEVSITGSRSTHVNLTANTRNVTITGCTFLGNATPVSQGGLLPEEVVGLRAQGQNHTITGNTFRNVVTGVELAGTNIAFNENTFDGVYNDFVRIKSATNVDILNNRMGKVLGFGALLHQDGNQFTGIASGVRIRGNVIWPGDFVENTIAQPMTVVINPPTGGGDQRTEYVSIGTTTTLTEALHNGKVASASADGLTFTLPASPEIGDTYWFRTENSGHSLTVAANTGQTHADGLLPRTVDNTRNVNTFMVYWNGTAWGTIYGLRAGIFYMPAGTRTLTDRFNGRIVLCDATNGNVDVTLPPHAPGAFGIGFSRLDRTGNTVTMRKDASDAWVYRTGGTGTPPASLQVTQGQSWTVRDSSTSDWDVWSGRWGELQGIFSNAYGHSDIQIEGNIIWAQGSNLLRLEDTAINDYRVRNNSFPKSVAAPSSAWFEIGGQTAVRGRGVGLRSYLVDNFTMGVYNLTDGTASELPNANNIGLDADRDNLTSTLAHLAGDPGSTTTLYPITVDEAIDFALAEAAGPLDGTWIGATGTTRTNGWYDFTNNQVNPLAPATTLPPGYDNGLAAPSVTASDSLSTRTLTISVDSLTGNPTPSTALTTLTLDGVDVSGSATGTGPWSYVVPSSSSAQTVAWVVTATNSEGSDTASGSEVVAADLSAGPTFADSLATTDYSSADWNDFGVGKTIVDGWLIKPGGRIRADTLTGAWANPGGDLTIVVDVRVSAGSGASTVTCRLNEVGGSGTSDGTIAPATGITGGNGGFTTVGSIDMGGGVWRFYMQRTVSAGTRILVELPQGNSPAADMTNPAIFAGTLTVGEITALA